MGAGSGAAVKAEIVRSAAVSESSKATRVGVPETCLDAYSVRDAGAGISSYASQKYAADGLKGPSLHSQLGPGQVPESASMSAQFPLLSTMSPSCSMRQARTWPSQAAEAFCGKR